MTKLKMFQKGPEAPGMGTPFDIKLAQKERDASAARTDAVIKELEADGEAKSQDEVPQGAAVGEVAISGAEQAVPVPLDPTHELQAGNGERPDLRVVSN